MSLNEISRFVRTVLADKGKLEKAVEGKSFDERVYLYLNLEKISSYIDKYNERADERLCMLGRIVHVILLILTLGRFLFQKSVSYRTISPFPCRARSGTRAVRKERSPRTLFLHLVSMSDADRNLILEKVGLLPKWSAFIRKASRCARKARNHFQKEPLVRTRFRRTNRVR